MSSPPQIFDRALYARRRAAETGSDFLVRDVAAHLAERILVMKPETRHEALDLSSRDESFAELSFAAKNWTRTALSPGSSHTAADEEMLPFGPESFDLVVSVLSLHAVNDLPGALIQIQRTLKPDGLFLAALFGGETLRELRDAFVTAESEVLGGSTPRVAPFADVRVLGALLQRAGFAAPVADVERMVVHYQRFDGLVRDLRALGETNILCERSRKILRRDVLAATLNRYRDLHSDRLGRFIATFDVIYLTGRTGMAETSSSRHPSKNPQ